MGAAIAAGNHAEKGIWALLVVEAITRRGATIHTSNLSKDWINRQGDITLTTNAIDDRIRQSPTRFLRAVRIPAFIDLCEKKYTTNRKEVTPKPSHPIRALRRLGLTISRTILITNNRTRVKNRL